MKMRNAFLILAFLTCLFMITSCNTKTDVDKLVDEGNTIIVRYDANGGTYLDRDGITLIDMYNPDNYTPDADGNISIKLVNPEDSSRPSGGSEGIYITRTNYFLVGWYQNRTVKTNSDNQVIDEDGNVLELVDDEYVLASDHETSATPAYTYSGYWDFDNDVLTYNASEGVKDITLYAVWAKLFEFDYYTKVDGVWTQYGSTNFNYMTTNATGSKTFDKDTIWVPSWVDGAMNYTHLYDNTQTYTFPKVSGSTFNSAYLDENCSNQISDSLEHIGTLDMATGVAVNPVMNVYVVFDEGEYYHISTASEFVNNANANGIYEILQDLDFTGLKWPNTFEVGTFKGQIISKDDQVYKFSNITISHNSSTAKKGGLFGELSSEAIIKNINFENVTIEYVNIGLRNRDASFGLFAGILDDNCTLSNVSLSGSMILGAISLGDGSEINLVTNGDTAKIKLTSDIKLYIKGTEKNGSYSYSIDPTQVKVENGNITLVSVTGKNLDKETYEINY